MCYDGMSAQEKQATPKATFVFLAPLEMCIRDSYKYPSVSYEIAEQIQEKSGMEVRVTAVSYTHLRKYKFKKSLQSTCIYRARTIYADDCLKRAIGC